MYLSQTCSFSIHKMLIDGLELSGSLLVYCDVFISCLDSHSDGTHSLQRIHWWASDGMLHFSKSFTMKKKLIYTMDGLRVSRFSGTFRFLGEQFFKVTLLCLFEYYLSCSVSCSSMWTKKFCKVVKPKVHDISSYCLSQKKIQSPKRVVRNLNRILLRLYIMKLHICIMTAHGLWFALYTVDQSQRTVPSDQSQQQGLTERRSLERLILLTVSHERTSFPSI